MKNVWILNHYAQEPGGAGGTRHYSLAKHLVENGWKATVIAASVELNTGRQRLESHEMQKKICFDGVDFLWVRTPEYVGNGGGRMKNMLIYAMRVLFTSTTQQLDRPDVIVGSSVHPFAAWAGAILAKRFGVPFIFEVRDLWPQTLIDMGRISEHGLTTRLLRWLERWLYVRASRIVVLLPKAADYIVPLGISAERIVWIPNGVELDGYPEPEPPLANDLFTLMYFGAHGQANGLDCLLKAMALLEDMPHMSRVCLRLIGDGPLKTDLVALAAELGLTRVSFEEPVPKRAIPDVARQADAFVFNLIDAPVFKFGISSNKLFDFLAGARPILFCSDASNNPVAESGSGITVRPGDPDALARGIERLVSMPVSQRIEMGRAGRKYVAENHSFRMLAAKFASMLNRVLAENK